MKIENGFDAGHENRFDLRNFFNYTNPHQEDYERLQEETRFQLFQQEFSGYWKNLLQEDYNRKHPRPDEIEKIKTFLHQKLQGQILLDLGCGARIATNPNSPIFDLVRAMNVNTYIGVDSRRQDSFTPMSKPRKLESISGYYLEADMLLTMARTPSDSVNIVMNGIDDIIVSDEEYNNALVTEMIRACKPGGIIFGSGGSSNFPGEKSVLDTLDQRIREGREPNQKLVTLIEKSSSFDPKFFEKISQ